MIAIDVIGKLGTLAVALAVFFSARAQNKWNNNVSRRAAAIEDQKLRLSLLDRRSAALEHVTRAVLRYWQGGEIHGDSIEAAAEALSIAELVFDARERDGIRQLLYQTSRWRHLQTRLKMARGRLGSDEERRALQMTEELNQLEGEMLKTFDPLVVMLREATRIGSVATLPAETRPRWPWSVKA